MSINNIDKDSRNEKDSIDEKRRIERSAIYFKKDDPRKHPYMHFTSDWYDDDY